MEYIVIDKKKCIRCLRCIDECPAFVLSPADSSAEVVNPELCISCGHCAAICPEGAVESSEQNTKHPFTVTVIPENLPADTLLFHRKRSVRAFRNERIDRRKIEKLVEYAEKAPSSHNLRNRRYIVITSDDDIARIRDKVVGTYRNLLVLLNPVALKLIHLLNKATYKELSELTLSFRNMIEKHRKGIDTIFRGSSCIVCIAAPHGSTHSKDDCIAAQQYMMLYGKTIDIDSFIVGFAQYTHKKLEKHLAVERGFSIFAVSAFGLARHRYENEVAYLEPQIKWC